MPAHTAPTGPPIVFSWFARTVETFIDFGDDKRRHRVSEIGIHLQLLTKLQIAVRMDAGETAPGLPGVSTFEHVGDFHFLESAPKQHHRMTRENGSE